MQKYEMRIDQIHFHWYPSGPKTVVVFTRGGPRQIFRDQRAKEIHEHIRKWVEDVEREEEAGPTPAG